MACIFCKKNSQTNQIFSDGELYQDSRIQFRKNIKQLLGVQATQHLKKGVSICSRCISELYRVEDLKRSFWNNLDNSQDQSVSTCSPLISETQEEIDSTEESPRKRLKRRESRVHSRASNRPPSSITELDAIWTSDTPSTSRSTPNSRGRSRRSTKSKSRRPSSASPVCTRSVSRHREAQIICEHCGGCYGDLDRLTCHLVAKHQLLALHFCDECNFRYTSQEHLRIHEKDFHDTSPFYCIICKVMTKNSEELQEHLQDHLKYKNTNCIYCDLSFLTDQQLEYHLRNDHKGKQKIKRIGFFYLEPFQSVLDNNTSNTNSVTNTDEKFFQMQVLILKKAVEENVINSERFNNATTQFREYCQNKGKVPITKDTDAEQGADAVSNKTKDRPKSQVVECTSTTDTTANASSLKNTEAGSQSSECSSSTDATVIERRTDPKSLLSEHCSSTNTISTDSEELGSQSESEVSSSPTLRKNKQNQKSLLKRTRTISVTITNFEQIMS